MEARQMGGTSIYLKRPTNPKSQQLAKPHAAWSDHVQPAVQTPLLLRRHLIHKPDLKAKENAGRKHKEATAPFDPRPIRRWQARGGRSDRANGAIGRASRG